ncbi:ABC transporter permease [Streptomyces violaceorubidus]
MLTVTLYGMRARWAAFVGSFVALALGVALLTVTGLALAASLDAPDRAPERFAAAPVVVRGQDTLRVPTPAGEASGGTGPAACRARRGRGPAGAARQGRRGPSFPVRVRGGRRPR